ncbi:MAG: helix-turn-helix transcriptional regulator [Oscillospiraceae bacterium]|nr:helix-turn-helix transcriptional regulator [Oscillospiraceae bacterium]
MFQIRINELRERAGYTSQMAFAKAFGVAQSTVAGWESGAREPNYKTTIRLAQFFNVTVGYLLGTEDYEINTISNGPWTKRFLDNLIEECANANSADCEAVGVDYEQLDRMLNGEVPVTLESACDLADSITGSLDQLVGMDILKAEKEKSPDTDDAASGDAVDVEINRLLLKLRPDQRGFVLALLRTLVEEGQESPLSAQELSSGTAVKSPN